MARVGRDVTVDQGAEVDDTVVLRAGASVGEFAHVAAGAPVARGVAVPGAPGPTDCFSVRGTGLDFGTGPVTIDPDRDGPNAPYDVWCEMDTDGGGWTRVMIHAGQGGNSWWWNNSPTYYQGRATAGTYDSLAADHLSYAFNDLPVTELLLATPTAPTLAVQRTFPAGMSGKSMRALFADQDTVTYAPGDGSPAAWEGLYAQFGQQVYTHRRAMMIALTYDEAVLLAPGLTPTGYARNVDVRLGAYDRNNWGDPWHITYGAQVAFLLNEPVSNGDPCALLTGSGYTKPNGQHGSGHDSCTATGGQADWLVYVR
jgi:hypothetical protein